jgi:hypothetical protein
MRALLAALTLLAAPPLAAQDEDEAPAIQRYLAKLQLGDRLDDVRRIYPPAQDWPSTIEPRGHVKRYRVERTWAKRFPPRVERLFLGFKDGRLREIQVVYDAQMSREQPAGKLAGEYALVYGKPQESDGRFWWSDRGTVLRVFPQELPTAPGSETSVELRTSAQVFERGLFERTD